jgi:hypothetical protein
MARSSWLAGAAALVAAACFADPNAEGAPGSASAPSDIASGGVHRECGPLGSLGRGACLGFDAYVACMDTECAPGFDACLGPAWRSGDHAGAECEELMGCIGEAPDPCNPACAAGPACQECLAAQLTACESYCSAHLDCASGSRPPACVQLEACCTLQEAHMRELCLADLRDVESTGERGCLMVLTTYCSG